MSKGAARFIFVLCLVVNCVLWSKGRYGVPVQSSLFEEGKVSLVRRISYELSQPLEARIHARSEGEASPARNKGAYIR